MQLVPHILKLSVSGPSHAVIDSDTSIGNDSSVSISAVIVIAVVGWILVIIIIIVVLTAIMIYKKRMKSGFFDAV